MVLSKEIDLAINLRKQLKIEQGSKLRVENEIQLKSTMDLLEVNNGNKNKKK